MMKSYAIVTGGGRNLGKAFALLLGRLGYTVVLHYHQSDDALAQTIRDFEINNFEVHSLKADLTNPPQLQDFFTNVERLVPNGSLKVLVNSAAFMGVSNQAEDAIKEWDFTLDLNLRAPYLLNQEAAKRMLDGGVLVNISDIGAQKTWTRYLSYSVSKSALEALTKLQARSFAPRIRVNAIAPGFVLQSDIVTKDQWTKLIDRVPLKRAATVEEITATLEFIIKNEYITGQTIVVDGGYSLV